MNKILLPLLAIAVFLTGCPRNITKPTPTASYPKNSEKFLQDVLKQNLTFQTLRIKGKAQVKQENQNLEFNYRIHIEHQKKIWASLSMLGIEGIRMLIEGDTVALINRIQQTYWKGSLQQLAAKWGLQPDLQAVEYLLIGNLLPFPKENLSFHNYTLLTNYQDVAFKMHFNPNAKIDTLILQQPSLNVHSLITYNNFQKLDNLLVPFVANILLNSPQSIQISLSHKEIEHNPSDLKFSFNIPDNYKPMDL